MLEYEWSEFDTRLLHAGQIIVGCWRLLASIPIRYYHLFVRRCKRQNTIFISLLAWHIHSTKGVPLVRLLNCSLPAPDVITQVVLDVGHRAHSIDHCRPLVIVFNQIVLVEELVGGDQLDRLGIHLPIIKVLVFTDPLLVILLRHTQIFFNSNQYLPKHY